MMYEDKREWAHNPYEHNEEQLGCIIREIPHSHLHKALRALYYDLKAYGEDDSNPRSMGAWIGTVVGKSNVRTVMATYNTVRRAYPAARDEYINCHVGSWRYNFRTIGRCHKNPIFRMVFLSIYLYQHYYC